MNATTIPPLVLMPTDAQLAGALPAGAAHEGAASGARLVGRAHDDVEISVDGRAFWEHLERENRRRDEARVDDRPIEFWAYLRRENERSAEAEGVRGGERAGPGDDEGVGLGMPRLGEIGSAERPELARKIEAAYRVETRLANGSIIDVLI